jgi:hypothetical protein
MTGKAWGAADLGMAHAQVIAAAIRGLDYDLALDMEGFLAEHAATLTVDHRRWVGCGGSTAGSTPKPESSCQQQ